MTETLTVHLIPLLGGLVSVPLLADAMPARTEPLQVALALLVAAFVRWSEMRFGQRKARSHRRTNRARRPRTIGRHQKK